VSSWTTDTLQDDTRFVQYQVKVTVLWNQPVRTDSNIRKNKPDISSQKHAVGRQTTPKRNVLQSISNSTQSMFLQQGTFKIQNYAWINIEDKLSKQGVQIFTCKTDLRLKLSCASL
jgi:hypothetical protein